MAVISCCSSSSRSMPFCREASHNYKSPPPSTIICGSRKSSTQLNSDSDSHCVNSPPRLLDPPSYSTSSIRWRGMGVAATVVVGAMVVLAQEGGAAYEENGWAAAAAAAEMSGRLMEMKDGEAEEGLKNLSRDSHNIVRKESRRRIGGECPQWRRSQWELVLPEVTRRPDRLPRFRAASASSSETGHHNLTKSKSKTNNNCFSL